MRQDITGVYYSTEAARVARGFEVGEAGSREAEMNLGTEESRCVVARASVSTESSENGETFAAAAELFCPSEGGVGLRPRVWC